MKLTLKGTLSYPWLTRLDTKHNADGEFKASVVTAQATHQQIADQLEQFLEEYMSSDEVLKRTKGKKPRQHPDGLPFTVDEEAGTITFRVKNKTYRNQEGQLFAFSTSYFDRNKQPLGIVKVDDGEVIASDTIPNIGGGTKAVASVEVRGWVVSGKAGLSLRPRAFKLVEVVEPVGGMNADNEFGDDDDDFDAPSVMTNAPAGMDNQADDEDF